MSRTKAYQKNFLLLLSIMSGHLHGEPLELSIIKESNLDNYPYIEEEYPDEEREYYKFLERILEYQLHPNERKKRCLFFDFYQQEDTPLDSIVNEQVLTDLLIVKGPRKRAPFFAERIGTPRTEIGKVIHYVMISRPTTDIALIQQRQQLIKWLSENTAVRDKIQEILNRMESVENGFISFWGNDGFKRASDHCYYHIFQGLNQYPALLQGKYIHDVLKHVATIATDAAATALLTTYALRCLGAPQQLCPSESLAHSYQSAAGPLCGTLAQLLRNNSTLQGFLSAYIAYYCSSEIPNDIEWEFTYRLIVRSIEQKVSAIVETVHALQELDLLLAANPALAELLQAVIPHTRACSLSQQSRSREELELFTLIDRFNHQGLTRQGCTLRLFKLIHQYKNLLYNSYQAAGYLDLFGALAGLLADPQSHYVFSEFLDGDELTLELVDFWNPFLTAQSAITNTITIGGTAPRNIIVTGANAGGKSTALKAITLNVVLAQSYGIAAASAMRLTPFHAILTSLNITDDIVQGNSRFKAEALRMQLIIDAAEHYAAQKYFTLALIDEPFNGTSPEAGTRAASRALQALGALPTHISLVATHYQGVATLANDISSFANFKVAGTVQPNGSIHYSFKLEPGAAHEEENVALQIIAGLEREQA